MRISIGALAIALAAAPAAAQDNAAPPPGAASGPIIVTAIRVEDYRARLAACLARNCPVNEDVDATMALAEALFLGGEYEDARRTVRLSLGRNRNHAAQFPEPVSDLHRVYALLSRQLGFDRVALQSTHRILNALEEGLPSDDHRHFTARLEVVEAQLAQGRIEGAERGLAELVLRARGGARGCRDHGRAAPDVVRLYPLPLWRDPQASGPHVAIARPGPAYPHGRREGPAGAHLSARRQ